MLQFAAFFVVLAVVAGQSSFTGCQKCQQLGLPAPPAGCAGPDCVFYDLTSQATCTWVENEGPLGVSSPVPWAAGLNLNVDNRIKGGKIITYRIRWSNGSWSQYFVPGWNDLDIKLTGCGMRRMWSYFTDHVHSYLICK